MEDQWCGPVYECYRHLPMRVMQADLWRYCILYQYGGIYADIDTTCNSSPSALLGDTEGHNNPRQFVVVPEYVTPLLCQWVYASAPGHPVLRLLIQKLIHREKEWRGKEWPNEHMIHFLTGPSIFTEAFNEYIHHLLQTRSAEIDEQVKNTITQNLEDKRYLQLHYPKDHPVFEDIVLLPYDFHVTDVYHGFKGSDADGWKNERLKYVKKDQD